MYLIISNILVLLCMCVCVIYSAKDKKSDTDDVVSESFVWRGTEYLVVELPSSWEDARTLCSGAFKGELAALESRDEAEFVAAALAHTTHGVQCAWVGARRGGAADPGGYRWRDGAELRRTQHDVLASEVHPPYTRHYPLWLNRTLVPVGADGADCVALERVLHDRPAFLDLPCRIRRPFVCQREASRSSDAVVVLERARCEGAGEYRVLGPGRARTDAAAYCLMHHMRLANISSVQCLRRVGIAMLKARPSVEQAWVVGGGAGRSEADHFGDNNYTEHQRSLNSTGMVVGVADDGECVSLDRHGGRAPTLVAAPCSTPLHFICYSGPSVERPVAPPSDDTHYYILVRERLPWRRAFDHCRDMNGTLAGADTSDTLTQLLVVMAETEEQPVQHIWLSGRLNMTKDVVSNTVTYGWYNPATGALIPDPATGPLAPDLYTPPWFAEEFSTDSPCLNLDRHEHLHGLVYGLPCDAMQSSICLVEKSKMSFNEQNLE